ncbi:hypothetical protein CKM354_000169700 [Cercospora kikuchii]|uniref:DNA ligase ATP-dependent N-terminal domain-containing protein n=1 Tax=Cercospora kikuchii TaxID=84275 RepID=A0A9P3C7S9_9PEZI|nr:uncharacterized protein CKM354_000169700 [Cercospora kikuchii]GIZ38277.1 hypothetical protein CKM354_000169700 [Cercospora kikuchii]
MSTPNKRRKTNNHQSPAQPANSLDFFFGKQRQKHEEAKEEPEHDAPPPKNNDDVHVEEAELTDEQLARKLQAEWDAEERQRGQQRDGQDHLSGRDTVDQEEDVVSNDQARGEQAAVTAEAKQEDKPTNTSNAFAAMGKKNTLSLQSATAEEDTISHDVPFDESPLTFDPQKYLPELRKQWASEGGRCTYALLTHCFVLVGSTTSRIKTVDTLVNMLRTLIEGDPASLLPAVWLATNSISPPYIDIELGLGGSAISKALKKVCGLDNAALKSLYNKHGDAGDVAYEAKKKQSFTLRKPKPLTIQGVYDSLHKIAAAKGQGSQVVKQSFVERLVQDARGAEESRYVVRTLVQHLRIGAVKTTMLIALSRAFLLSKQPGAEFDIKSREHLRKLSKQDLAAVYQGSEELVKACFARRPNYNDLVPTMLEIGIDEELLLRCGLAMHIPLRPMVATSLVSSNTTVSEHRFTAMPMAKFQSFRDIWKS